MTSRMPADGSRASDAASPQLEQIVAYLDGELSPTEGAEVERLLASDETYRNELQSVERAWSALAVLDPVVVGDRFAKSTLELTVKAAQQEVDEKTRALPLVRRRRRFATLLVATGTAIVGYFALHLALPNPNAKLLADLGAIHNIEIYSQLRSIDGVEFDAIEFLRRLHTRGGELLDEPLAPGASMISSPPEGLEQRPSWIEALAPEAKIILRAKANRFDALSQEEQGRIRELHRKIAADDNSSALFDVLNRYQIWLASVPQAQQFELRSLAAGPRCEKVCEWAAQKKLDAPLELTDEQLKEVAGAVRTVLVDGAPGNGPSSFPRRRREAVLRALDDEAPGPVLRRVLEALPEHARNAFILLPAEKRYERLTAWFRRAVALRGEVTQRELEQFFSEELDVEQREAVLLLPTSEAHESLMRLYDGRSKAEERWAPFGPPRPRDGRPPGLGPGGPPPFPPAPGPARP